MRFLFAYVFVDDQSRFMRMTMSRIRAILAACAVISCAVPAAIALTAAGVASAQSRRATPNAVQAAQATALSFERFTLPNGLRILVHTDRKAPVVAINLRYGVGARNESAARSGFAHLFEHLMFGGSDNAPGNFLNHMAELGAPDVNGHTGYDDTLFNETVPRGALERALFLEADRMGHMRRAIDQAMLNVNRGVVQNEKRQNDNLPYGVASYRTLERLFPPDHPYGRPIIGSMPALDAATVEDAREWHSRYYVPANAVLVLAGDIDALTARRLVTRYFGGLPAGAPASRPPVALPTLAAPMTDVETDRVAETRITRHWVTPGRLSPDGMALDIAAKVLGTLTGAWLDKVLVRDERLASSVVTSSGAHADVGTFIISMTLAEGVTPERASARLDSLLARFVREGPSKDELRRVVMRDIGWYVAGLETASGQASTLSEGEMLAHDPLFAARSLEAAARLRPADIRTAAARWLTRPAYTLMVVPGERPAYADSAPTPANNPSPATDATRPAPRLPAVAPPVAPPFPVISRSRLSNGIELVHARRPGVALTRLAMAFDAGTAADLPDQAGAQTLLLAMLGEGTATRDATAIAREREGLGASIWFEPAPDRSVGMLTAPSTALIPALDLFADMIRRPAFAPARLAQVKATRLALIRQEATNPDYLAWQAMAPLLYGVGSPYARAGISGDAGAVSQMTQADLTALHRAWIRPETARLFVVSDLPDANIRAMAERVFGDWRGRGVTGRKHFALPPSTSPRIIIVDRPGNSQSIVLGAVRAPGGTIPPLDTTFAATVANEPLGGFRGRINMDLRERRGWVYGTGGRFDLRSHALTYSVLAPVQADRTGDALEVIRRHLADYLGARPMTQKEFDRTVYEATAGMAYRYESGETVLAAMQANQLLGRPDDFQAGLFHRYNMLRRASAVDALRALIVPDAMAWVVVGDATRIRPQLNGVGLPVTVTSNALLTAVQQTRSLIPPDGCSSCSRVR